MNYTTLVKPYRKELLTMFDNEIISGSLEAAILQNAPNFTVSETAPNTFKDLKACGLTNLVVYSGNCEDTIYSSPEVNHSFRAWHDKLHLIHNLNFSREHELQVAAHHVEALDNPLDKALIWSDVAGQVEFYFKHKKFVENQRNFLKTFIETGAV